MFGRFFVGIERVVRMTLSLCVRDRGVMSIQVAGWNHSVILTEPHRVGLL